MKIVMCFGTFDLFHLGHLNYFKQAKQFGDHLIVVISRDKNVKKQLVFNENERLDLIKQLKIVDKAVLGNNNDFLKIIEKENPNVVCLGYDHQINEKDLENKLLERGLNLIVKKMAPYQTHKHKSSYIKNTILQTLS